MSGQRTRLLSARSPLLALSSPARSPGRLLLLDLPVALGCPTAPQAAQLMVQHVGDLLSAPHGLG